MNRACQRFPIPKTIEWINSGNYIVTLNGRDETSEESDASHGCGNKDAPLLKTRRTCATAVHSRKSCMNIDVSPYNIDDLDGNDLERTEYFVGY